MQGHKHTDRGHSHDYHTVGQWQGFDGQSGASWNGQYDTSTGTSSANLGLPTKYSDDYGEPRISTENKPKCITVRYWKRTA